nr:hypothetical protein GCM10020185_39770 [Pseudomonas brassicacearum subsp. brassicacearum]
MDWQDGHQSRFDPGWLRAHAYDDQSRAERLANKPRRQLWRHDLQLPVFDYPALMDDTDALLQWLLAVRDIGLTQVRGVPTEPGSLKRIAQRISFIRESNFGVLFNVQSKADADSNAYTAFNLPLHSDLPTRELQPGLQFLHCLVNDADGGESIFLSTGFPLLKRCAMKTPRPSTRCAGSRWSFATRTVAATTAAWRPSSPWTPSARFRKSAWRTSCVGRSTPRSSRCPSFTAPTAASLP